MNFLDIAISLLLIVLSIVVITSKDIIKSIIVLSALSMMTAVAYVILKAPDVALTEIVIGSGLITFLFLFSYKRVKKAGEEEWKKY